MITLYLNTLWFILAVQVFLRYGGAACREPAHTTARTLMSGITLGGLAMAINRGYWLPWYWLTAIGVKGPGRADAFDSFWSNLFLHHDWLLIIGMLLSIISFHFHLHLSRSAGGLLRSIGHLTIVLLAALLVPALTLLVLP